MYSTDINFKFSDDITDDVTTLPPGQQELKIKLDAKQRAGKVVTLVQGFEGKQADLEDLGKSLKTFCGTGGSVKENEIIVQGDHRDKIVSWLHKKGYSRAKRI